MSDMRNRKSIIIAALAVALLTVCGHSTTRAEKLSEPTPARKSASNAPQDLPPPEADQLPTSSAPERVPGELFIKVAATSFAPAKFPQLITAAKMPDCAYVSAVPLLAPRKADARQMRHTYRMTVAGDHCAVDSLAHALTALPQVIYAEPNLLYHVQQMPNDPEFPQQWHLHTPVTPPNVDIDAPEAWDIRTDARTVIVGLLDTGVDYTHPDIGPINDPATPHNLWINPCEDLNGNGVVDLSDFNGRDDPCPGEPIGNGFRDDIYGYNFDRGNNNPSDTNGHGTRMAGVIAAKGNNGRGVAGVAWRGQLMNVQVCAGAGSCDPGAIHDGIIYATDNGARIINLSLGGPPLQVIADAVEYAYDNDVLVVASAGNSNFYRIIYPAAMPHAVAVGATGTHTPNRKAYFASYGAGMDLTAPGEDIHTLQEGGVYAESSGTSPATAMVSGVAALVLSENPGLSRQQLENVLKNTADDLDLPGYDQVSGYGKVNAARALSGITMTATLLAEMEAPFQDQVLGQFPFTVTGTAQSPQLQRYTLEWGRGDNPASWTLIAAGTSPKTREALGTFDPTGFAADVYTLRVTVFDRNLGAREGRATIHVERLLSHPVELPYTLTAGGRDIQPHGGIAQILVDHLDTDSAREVLVPVGRRLKGFKADGALLPTWDKEILWNARDPICNNVMPEEGGGNDRFLGEEFFGLASGELNGPGSGVKIVSLGGGNKLVMDNNQVHHYCEGALRIFDLDGTELFEHRLIYNGDEYGAGSYPAIGDLDGDGQSEIVFLAFNAPKTGWAVFAMHADGTHATGWPVLLDQQRGINVTSVSIGDLEGDGTLEVVVNDRAGATSDLWVLNADGTVRYRHPGEGWGGQWGRTSPILGNLDAEPELELLTTANWTLIADQANGNPFWAFNGRSIASLAMGYLEEGCGGARFGIPIDQSYFRVGGLGRNAVVLLDQNGRTMPGFPSFYNEWSRHTQPVSGGYVLADVDGDQQVEVIFIASEPFEYKEFAPGSYTLQRPKTWNSRLYAMRLDGTMLPGYPKLLNGAGELMPVVTDINKDGNADIVVSSFDYVYIFDTGAAFTGIPWAMAGHDNTRTNRYETCGDGLVTPETGEVCDDGNRIPGDGCSASCEWEAEFRCGGITGLACPDGYQCVMVPECGLVVNDALGWCLPK